MYLTVGGKTKSQIGAVQSQQENVHRKSRANQNN